MTKWVYTFGPGISEGEASEEFKNLLGGKGSNLAEMSKIDLPVPPGFTVTTEVCTAYYENDKNYPAELEAQVLEAIAKVEASTGKEFGSETNPLLLSVRSGARVSMPGMMDTVLNLGLTDTSVKAMADKAGARFAYDSYRRFIQMFSDVVMGVEHHDFEKMLNAKKDEKGVEFDTQLTAEDLAELCEEFKAHYKAEIGEDFPQDPKTQLWAGIGAVFGSWMTERAVFYRRLNDFDDKWGTAVNVQAMVFGNMGDDCATGVAFTRNPSTGENYFYGEFLVNAQGEDVVAGIRTPHQLDAIGKERAGCTLPTMEDEMPEIYSQLNDIRLKLEAHYKDIQDIEFTSEQGKLYMLQTRTGKRTAGAALKIAIDMVEEGLIDKEEAVLRVEPESLDQLLHPTLDPKAEKVVLTKGLPASPGAASGILVLSAEEAEEKSADGTSVILCRVETSPEDIAGMHVSKGIVTAKGGMTSHAAVVARGMGRACVAGAGEVVIDYAGRKITVNGTVVNAGETVTIDGGTGELMAGKIDTIEAELTGDFGTLMAWADEIRTLKVRANAETPEDARTAKRFGAEGIGLARTEHMFFEPERIIAVREMILSEDVAGRETALAKLLPMQKCDFKELFKIMDGEVNVRLLDPPLHEFLPHTEEDQAELAKVMGVELSVVKQKMDQLHESNPMLGHRGCRLGVTYPEISAMQARAIFTAAAEVMKEDGTTIIPEVMIPLVSTVGEFALIKDVVDAVAKEVMSETGTEFKYLVGTMIELPRAALVADKIVEAGAEFFSFGTNDLTQTTFGISRDDAGMFLPEYTEKGIIAKDPFVALDQEGVGQLVAMGKEKGRSVNPDITVGICGEHGGEPSSIDFCHRTGLTYVSCSPYRVPIARLAAAHATLKNK